MPGVQDWTTHPLDIIQKLLNDSSGNEDHTLKVLKYFENKLSTNENFSRIPSLNEVPLQELCNNSIVRFRCMIQDMFDPEYFLGIVETTHCKSGQKELRNGKFCDLIHCETNYELNLQSERNVTMDRQTFYCVPIPGENLWVKTAFSTSQKKIEEREKDNKDKEELNEKSLKRQLDVNESLMETNENGEAIESDQSTANENIGFKRVQIQKEGTSANKTLTTCGISSNFPLPGETGPSCFVKVYKDYEDFKLNNVVEFFGILSVDPHLATFPDSADSDDLELMGDDFAHQTPPSLVPRLHVLFARKLVHINPFIPVSISPDTCNSDLQLLALSTSNTRAELISLLEFILLGDKLAAEYLLFNLISSVYARRDILALGKFALNISGCNEKLPTVFYNFIKELVTKSHYMPLSLDLMNTSKFQPQKDYQTNQLKSGLLQLSDRTQLVIDETALQPGQLNADGIRNLAVLSNLIKWQKLDYNFNFYQHEYQTDLNLIVLSEGKSMLPCDCIIPLQTSPSSTVPELSTLADLNSNIGDKLLKDIRCYITLCQQLPYNVPDDLQQKIQLDFVEARRDDPNKLSVEDFHMLLCVARLLTLSLCKNSLTEEIWNMALEFERLRKLRIPATQPQVAQNLI